MALASRKRGVPMSACHSVARGTTIAAAVMRQARNDAEAPKPGARVLMVPWLRNRTRFTAARMESTASDSAAVVGRGGEGAGSGEQRGGRHAWRGSLQSPGSPTACRHWQI
jgi:hypothetical protein